MNVQLPSILMAGASSQHKQTGLLWWHQSDSLEIRGKGLRSAPGFGFLLHDFRSPTAAWSALTQPKAGASRGHCAAASFAQPDSQVMGTSSILYHPGSQSLSKGSRLAKACQKPYDLCRNVHWNVFNGFLEKKNPLPSRASQVFPVFWL